MVVALAKITVLEEVWEEDYGTGLHPMCLS